MIGFISGQIIHCDSDHIIVQTGGVGYIIYASDNLLNTLTFGNNCELWIETVVHNDTSNLYGFSSITERKWFNILQTVQGVGAKMAISILSHYRPLEIAQFILDKDINKFLQISGIGKKIATRIVTELTEKAAKNFPDVATMAIDINQIAGDVISALINLGFNRHNASKVALELNERNPSINFDDLLRLSLSQLTQQHL